MENTPEKPKARKKTRPSKEPKPTEEEMTAWADRMVSVWDMVSDFSGFLGKAKVKLIFTLLQVDGTPMLLSNPQLSQESTEAILEHLGKHRKRYAKRSFEIAQSAPAYSLIKDIERMQAGREKP